MFCISHHFSCTNIFSHFQLIKIRTNQIQVHHVSQFFYVHTVFCMHILTFTSVCDHYCFITWLVTVILIQCLNCTRTTVSRFNICVLHLWTCSILSVHIAKCLHKTFKSWIHVWQLQDFYFYEGIRLYVYLIM